MKIFLLCIILLLSGCHIPAREKRVSADKFDFSAYNGKTIKYTTYGSEGSGYVMTLQFTDGTNMKVWAYKRQHIRKP